MSKKITITGATGTIGSLVVPQLIAGGAEVTALVRDPEKAKVLSDQGVNLVQGDYYNDESVAKTLEGADSLIIIVPPNPEAVEQNSKIIQAAKNSGNPHVIRISAIGAAPDAPTDNGRLHFKSDEELKATGLTYTILRPHYFMQNLFWNVQTILEQGAMYLGMGDGKLGLIDARDIADVAAKVALEGGNENEIYTPTGPEILTFDQMAVIISEHIGKEVKYVKVSVEEVQKASAEFMGEWGGQVMRDYSQAYSDNWGNFTTDDVEKVTGNKARSFKDFVEQVLTYALNPEPVS